MGIRQTFEPVQNGGSCPVMRFEAGNVLSKLEASGLMALGCVHLISVASIRTAFGERWTGRKALVWDMAEAQILKRISGQDFCARVSEFDFAVITPKLDRADAQFLAVRISREILHHFLGDSYDQDISIKVATSFRNQQIVCQQITEAELLAALAANDSAGFKRPPKIMQTSPDETTPSKSVSGEVTTSNGLRLRFSHSVDPIIDLHRWAVAGHRIEPKISFERSGVPLSPQERRQLLPPDVEAIDIASLRRGLQRLSSLGASKSTIVLSVSFLTVSNTRSRTALLDLACEAKTDMERAVIWEITDFDAGVPAGRLHDCIAWLSPFSRAVFARAEAGTLSAISEKSTGRCGLIFQPEAIGNEDEAAAWLMSTGRIASKRSATLIAANLPSKTLLPLASSVGFTHATLRQV